MCDFMTIASIGLSIAGQAAEYSSARSQYKAQMEMHRQNAINANKMAANQYDNLNIKLQQEDATRHQQKFETGIEAAKAVSSLEVAAGEGGVSGNTVNALLRDLYGQKGRSDAVLDVNARMSRDYLKGEMKAVQLGAQNQINSVPIPERPSFAPYLINAFGSGLQAYAGGKQRKGIKK